MGSSNVERPSNYLPSEICRIVYGYLGTINCSRTRSVFLEENAELRELATLVEKKLLRRIELDVDGLHLDDILNQYALLKYELDKLFSELTARCPELNGYKSDGPLRKLEMLSDRWRRLEISSPSSTPLSRTCPTFSGSLFDRISPSATNSTKSWSNSQRHRTRQQRKSLREMSREEREKANEGAILAVEQYTRPRLRISEDSLDPEVAHGGKRHKTRQLCHHFTEDEKKAADEEAKRALGSISRNAPSASINPVPSTSSGLLPATLTSTADTHPDQVLAATTEAEKASTQTVQSLHKSRKNTLRVPTKCNSVSVLEPGCPTNSQIQNDVIKKIGAFTQRVDENTMTSMLGEPIAQMLASASYDIDMAVRNLLSNPEIFDNLLDEVWETNCSPSKKTQKSKTQGNQISLTTPPHHPESLADDCNNYSTKNSTHRNFSCATNEIAVVSNFSTLTAENAANDMFTPKSVDLRHNDLRKNASANEVVALSNIDPIDSHPSVQNHENLSQSEIQVEIGTNDDIENAHCDEGSDGPDDQDTGLTDDTPEPEASTVLEPAANTTLSTDKGVQSMSGESQTNLESQNSSKFSIRVLLPVKDLTSPHPNKSHEKSFNQSQCPFSGTNSSTTASHLTSCDTIISTDVQLVAEARLNRVDDVTASTSSNTEERSIRSNSSNFTSVVATDNLFAAEADVIRSSNLLKSLATTERLVSTATDLVITDGLQAAASEKNDSEISSSVTVPPDVSTSSATASCSEGQNSQPILSEMPHLATPQTAITPTTLAPSSTVITPITILSVGSSNSITSATLPTSNLSIQPGLPNTSKQGLLPNLPKQANVISSCPVNIAVPKSQFNFQLKPLQETAISEVKDSLPSTPLSTSTPSAVTLSCRPLIIPCPFPDLTPISSISNNNLSRIQNEKQPAKNGSNISALYQSPPKETTSSANFQTTIPNLETETTVELVKSSQANSICTIGFIDASCIDINELNLSHPIDISGVCIVENTTQRGRGKPKSRPILRSNPPKKRKEISPITKPARVTRKSVRTKRDGKFMSAFRTCFTSVRNSEAKDLQLVNHLPSTENQSHLELVCDFLHSSIITAQSLDQAGIMGGGDQNGFNESVFERVFLAAPQEDLNESTEKPNTDRDSITTPVEDIPLNLASQAPNQIEDTASNANMTSIKTPASSETITRDHMTGQSAKVSNVSNHEARRSQSNDLEGIVPLSLKYNLSPAKALSSSTPLPSKESIQSPGLTNETSKEPTDNEVSTKPVISKQGDDVNVSTERAAVKSPEIVRNSDIKQSVEVGQGIRPLFSNTSYLESPKPHSNSTLVGTDLLIPSPMKHLDASGSTVHHAKEASLQTPLLECNQDKEPRLKDSISVSPPLLGTDSIKTPVKIGTSFSQENDCTVSTPLKALKEAVKLATPSPVKHRPFGSLSATPTKGGIRAGCSSPLKWYKVNKMTPGTPIKGPNEAVGSEKSSPEKSQDSSSTEVKTTPSILHHQQQTQNIAKRLPECGEIRNKNYIFVSPSKQQQHTLLPFTTTSLSSPTSTTSSSTSTTTASSTLIPTSTTSSLALASTSASAKSTSSSTVRATTSSISASASTTPMKIRSPPFFPPNSLDLSIKCNPDIDKTVPPVSLDPAVEAVSSINTTVPPVSLDPAIEAVSCPNFLSPSKRAPKRAVLSRVLERPDKVEPGAFCSRWEAQHDVNNLDNYSSRTCTVKDSISINLAEQDSEQSSDQNDNSSDSSLTSEPSSSKDESGLVVGVIRSPPKSTGSSPTLRLFLNDSDQDTTMSSLNQQKQQQKNNELQPESSHTAQLLTHLERSQSLVPKKRWRKSAEEFVKALSQNKTSPKENLPAKIVSQESPSSANSKMESAKRPRSGLSTEGSSKLGQSCKVRKNCKSLCKQLAVESEKECRGRGKKKSEIDSNKNAGKISTPKRKRNDVSTSLYDEEENAIVWRTPKSKRSSKESNQQPSPKKSPPREKTRLIVKISPYQGPEVPSISFTAATTEKGPDEFVKIGQHFGTTDLVESNQVVKSVQTLVSFSLEDDLALSQSVSLDRISSSNCSLMQNDQSSSTPSAVSFSNIVSKILTAVDQLPGRSAESASLAVKNVLKQPDTVQNEKPVSQVLELNLETGIVTNCKESLDNPSEQSGDLNRQPQSSHVLLENSATDLTKPLVEGKVVESECLFSEKPTTQLTLSPMEIYFDQEPFAQEENDSN